LNSSCYEGTTAGYCGTGVCCCGGQCLTDECDYGFSSSSSSSGRRRLQLLGSDRCYGSSSADQSDSSDGYVSYTEWFKDKCEITDDEDEYAFDSGSSSSGRRRRRRRRQLIGASFGSRRKLMSSSSGYGLRYETVTSSDYKDEFIVETCITYSINITADCIEIGYVFLPLCQNNYTNFNYSLLTEDDLDSLITNETFANDNNVANAYGATRNGMLGIIIELKNESVSTFELCLGNITVNGENLDTLNVTTIDTSSGIVYVNNSGAANYTECPIDGLPCFDFFFDAPCPNDSALLTTTMDQGLPAPLSIERDCNCEEGTTSFSLTYTGDNDATVVLTRSRRDGAEYGSYSVSNGDTFTVYSISAGFDTFAYITGVNVYDAGSGDVICIYDRLYASRPYQVGRIIGRCSVLTVNSFVCADGALCDDTAVADYYQAVSADDALVNAEQVLDDPLRVFSGLDPYVRYSLIGLLLTFAGLMLVACYICVARKDEGAKDRKQPEKILANMQQMHRTHDQEVYVKSGKTPITMASKQSGSGEKKETEESVEMVQRDESSEREQEQEEKDEYFEDPEIEKAEKTKEEEEEEEDAYFDGDDADDGVEQEKEETM